MIGKKVFETEKQLLATLADPNFQLKEEDCVVIGDKYCRICRPAMEHLTRKKQGIIFYSVTKNDTTPSWDKIVSH